MHEHRMKLGTEESVWRKWYYPSWTPLDEEEEFKNYLRMTPGYFDELFEFVKDNIKKKMQIEIEACCNSTISLY